MKNAVTTLAIFAVVLASGVGVVAQSGDTDVEGTGPNSNTEIVFDNDCTIRITTENNVVVNIENNQDADSGDADSDGNTQADNSESGDATNRAETEFGITINNELPADFAGRDDCPIAVAEEDDNGDDEDNGQSGIGGGTVAGNETPITPAEDVEQLPDTGTSALAIGGVISAAVIVMAVGSRALSAAVARN